MHSTWWAPALGVAALALHAWHLRGWTLDDAFIFFRYAENWAAGYGPVYNPGERVEGYTSFLWLAILTCGRWLGADTGLVARICGLVFAVACMGLVASAAHRAVPGGVPRDSHLATLLLGTSGVFTAWTLSGMEVMLEAFLLTACVLLSARLIATCTRADPGVGSGAPGRWTPILLGVLGALLSATRPEGVVVFGVLWLDLVRRGGRSRRAPAGLAVAVFVAILSPLLIWRLSYYGYPFPNTFYAKVGATPRQFWNGAVYSLRFAIPAAALLAPFLVAWVSGRWRRRYPALGVLPVLVGAEVAAVVFVGGDLMPAFRFYAPITPLLCLAATWSLAAVVPRRRLATALALLSAAYGVACARLVPELDRRIRDDHVAQAGMVVGTWLAANVPADALLATNTAGSVPYYSRLRTIDMLGLNDAHIAHRKIGELGRGWVGHEKGDGAYVLSRRPDYIFFGSSLGSVQPFFRSDRELDAQPLFHQLYESCVYDLSLEGGGSLTVALWRKRGLRYP